jgi:4a-hydroxytetrahydrobiopterin dehydratase
MLTFNELHQRHCGVSADEHVMSATAIRQQLSELPQWQLSEDGAEIYREFRFKGFLSTMSFINAMAWVANGENHHPDFSAGFNYCRVSFTTHDAGGVTLNDFICAARVSALLN